MKLRIPYMIAALVAGASLTYLANTPAISAAPLVSFTTISGQEINLAAPQGKTRLVSFWAPDCPISHRDVSGISQLQQQFAEDEFEIVAVAMPYADQTDINAHVKSKDIDFAIAHDVDGSISDGFPGVRFTPTTFLIDGNGQIVWRHVGELDETKAAGQITELLQPGQLAQK